jgi:hypothetical protein
VLSLHDSEEAVKKLSYSKIVLGLFLVSLAARANPIDVSYTVSGTSGAYVLDFTVTNNLLAFPSQDVYFFGVDLSGRDIIGSPAGYDPNDWTSWTNTSYGGSSTVYNNNWIDSSYSDLLPGGSLSGFEVQISDPVAPTAVSWFAYAYSADDADPYTGGGNFNSQQNPGFEELAGTGTGASVPEPTTWIGMLTGLACLGLWHRKRSLV